MTTHVISRARLRAALYASARLCREATIAGRPVPREVVELRDWAEREWRQPSPARQRIEAAEVELDANLRRVGTREAAHMLGWTTRRVQRHADMLDGQMVAGRLVFRVCDLHDYARSNRLQLKEIQ